MPIAMASFSIACGVCCTMESYMGLLVLLSRTPWPGLPSDATCVTSQYLSHPLYVTHRHNNVNPAPPSERDVIYGRHPTRRRRIHCQHGSGRRLVLGTKRWGSLEVETRGLRGNGDGGNSAGETAVMGSTLTVIPRRL